MKSQRLTLLKRIRMTAGPFTTMIERGMLVEQPTSSMPRWSLSLAGELPSHFIASNEVLFEAGKYRGTCHIRNVRSLEGAGELVRLF
jgi:hypothetical protein